MYDADGDPQRLLWFKYRGVKILKSLKTTEYNNSQTHTIRKMKCKGNKSKDHKTEQQELEIWISS